MQQGHPDQHNPRELCVGLQEHGLPLHELTNQPTNHNTAPSVLTRVSYCAASPSAVRVAVIFCYLQSTCQTLCVKRYVSSPLETPSLLTWA